MLNSIEGIKSILVSSCCSEREKARAYSSLQQLQQHDSSLNFLIHSSPTILSSILADIRAHHSNEHLVASALKCLGFMIYHPSIVAFLSNQCVSEVLDSLPTLITTTKIKAVCNLGVWCLSIQQLDASSLLPHFHSLLSSILHSLDNPAASLSTTFEAFQAVIKLGAQLSENMRDSSNLWAPPIYRRLLSHDKRERDMSQRCLFNIRSLIIPPQQPLSKVIAHDLKLSLLPAMKEMLKQGKKVQALVAWRWFISIHGYHSFKSRPLVNELLKLPENTFSDTDPQVQIATMVAWEGLIDALVAQPSQVCETVTISQLHMEQNKVKSEASAAYSKGLKLIMTPIIGIMASKVDFSVHSSCLNTWYYLLHKLNSSVNDPSILDTVVEPMLKAVFRVKLNDENIWTWNICVTLLHDFIRSKCSKNGSQSGVSCNSSHGTINSPTPLCGSSALKTYSVKWLPWDYNQMDFFVRMIQLAHSQVVEATLSSKNNNHICDIMPKMFRFFLKGIQIALKKSSTTFDTVMKSINAIFGIVKIFFEAALCVDGESNSFQVVCLRSLEAVTEELEPCILGSSLYKIPMDVEYVCQVEAKFKLLAGGVSLSLMDMVLPVTYLTALYYYVVTQVSTKALISLKSTLQDAYSYLTCVLSLYDFLDVLNAINASLYAYVDNSSLRIWISVAHSLRDHLYGAKDLLPLTIQPNSSRSHILCKFFIYPLLCCSCESIVIPEQCKTILLENCVLEEVVNAWTTLYSYVCCSILQESQRKNWFAEEICPLLMDFLCQQSCLSGGVPVVNGDCNGLEHQLLSLCGAVSMCIVENLNIEKVTPEAIKCKLSGSPGIENCFEFIARLMNIIQTKMEEPPKSAVISRLLPPLIHVVGRFQWQEDITSFFKVLGGPLLSWMSNAVMKSGCIKDNLSLLWAEMITSLHRSWPSIKFDDSFLKLQAPLLEKTLDHPNPSVSEATVNFWNSAYGDQPHLNCPPQLIHILDKLSQCGKIKMRNHRATVLEKDESSLRVDDLPRDKVTTTLRVCSKRVELPSCPKRKRAELTEHQREVRRAQQGKSRDCSGHGPGIRTYTNLDFSQGNEDSQDSQEIRDPEMILDLLKKVGQLV